MSDPLPSPFYFSPLLDPTGTVNLNETEWLTPDTDNLSQEDMGLWGGLGMDRDYGRNEGMKNDSEAVGKEISEK